jgi:hypothetical protein
MAVGVRGSLGLAYAALPQLLEAAWLLISQYDGAD